MLLFAFIHFIFFFISCVLPCSRTSAADNARPLACSSSCVCAFSSHCVLFFLPLRLLSNSCRFSPLSHHSYLSFLPRNNLSSSCACVCLLSMQRPSSPDNSSHRSRPTSVCFRAPPTCNTPTHPRHQMQSAAFCRARGNAMTSPDRQKRVCVAPPIRMHPVLLRPQMRRNAQRKTVFAPCVLAAGRSCCCCFVVSPLCVVATFKGYMCIMTSSSRNTSIASVPWSHCLNRLTTADFLLEDEDDRQAATYTYLLSKCVLVTYSNMPRVHYLQAPHSTRSQSTTYLHLTLRIQQSRLMYRRAGPRSVSRTPQPKVSASRSGRRVPPRTAARERKTYNPAPVSATTGSCVRPAPD